MTVSMLKHTSVRPSPPGSNQSNPDRSFRQQNSSEVLENVVVEAGQTAVISQTSVDCSEPVDSLSVNLVASRVVHDSAATVRLCSIVHVFIYFIQRKSIIIHPSSTSYLFEKLEER